MAVLGATLWNAVAELGLLETFKFRSLIGLLLKQGDTD